MFAYTCRKPGITTSRQRIKRPALKANQREDDDNLYKDQSRNPFVAGDRVFLKPVSKRCNDVWSGPHTITKILNSVSVEINDDKVARHVSFLRLVP